jgi:hypothetical protein
MSLMQTREAARPRAERRAAPKPARTPSGGRVSYPTRGGLQ